MTAPKIVDHKSRRGHKFEDNILKHNSLGMYLEKKKWQLNFGYSIFFGNKHKVNMYVSM